MPFIAPIQYTKHGDTVTLTAPLVHIDRRGFVDDVVPAGFDSDGMTRPGLLRTWFPRFGRFLAAYVRHDHGYRTHAINGHAVPRRRVDRELVRDLQAAGCESWKLAVTWAGVRLFGWWAWNRKKGRT